MLCRAHESLPAAGPYTQPMLVITWNVNSIKTRLDRVLALLERHEPDALCLQELKCDAEKFPLAEIEAAGYHAAVHTQKTYNGVAVLTKVEPEAVRLGFDDDGFEDSHARLVTVTLPAPVKGVKTFDLVNGYFPNGGTTDSDKYIYKLDWCDRLRRRLKRDLAGGRELVLVGDYNVAPSDHDVANPDKWRASVLCAEPSRRAIRRLEALGLADCFRKAHPIDEDNEPSPTPGERAGLSWWDYRARGWENNDGLRIDHIFATRKMLSACSECFVDTDERDPERGEGAPSDHAPVCGKFG